MLCSCVPGINAFLKETVKNCIKNGYVQTLMGRRRYLPGITNTNTHIKAHVGIRIQKKKSEEKCMIFHLFLTFSISRSLIQAERQAVNTTVQGSAADIVKLATVNIQRRLQKTYPAASLSHQHTRSGDKLSSEFQNVSFIINLVIQV